MEQEKNNRISIVSLVVIIICVMIVIFYFSGKNLINQLATTTLAEIPDTYYQSMSLSGGVAKNLDGISFSSNGKDVAFIVKETGKMSVYLNNTPGTWYDSVSMPGFAFSSNGEHYVYSAMEAGDYFVVVDGKEQQHYKDSISTFNLYISPSGIPAYTVAPYGKNLGDSSTEYAVFNDHPGKTYRAIEYLKMSPDGQNIVYYGCNTDYHDPYKSDLNSGSGFCTFITQDLNGKITEDSGIFYFHGIDEAIYRGNITYSPDGKMLAFTSRLGDTDSIKINGVNTFSAPGDYSEMNISGITFSRDSKHIAYLVQGCNQDNPCPLDNLGESIGGVWYTVVDNADMGTKYEEIKNLTFDNNGQLAYFARTGDQWLFIDGSNTYNMPADFTKFPSLIYFSKDNSYLYSYADINGKTFLILNGKQIAQGDYTAFPGFTPDGKVIYWSIASDSKSMSLIIDGVEHKHDVVSPILSLPNSMYDSFYKFTSDGKIVYGAIDGKDISIIVE